MGGGARQSSERLGRGKAGLTVTSFQSSSGKTSPQPFITKEKQRGLEGKGQGQKSIGNIPAARKCFSQAPEPLMLEVGFRRYPEANDSCPHLTEGGNFNCMLPTGLAVIKVLK